jgi:hypothetical protein
MKHISFMKSDIPALDFIIDKTLETDWKVYSNELIDEGFMGKTDPLSESKFEALLAIINSYGCAKVNSAHNVDNGANVEKNGLTAKFKVDGGFKKAFKENQKEKLIKFIKRTGYFIAIISTLIIIAVNMKNCKINDIVPSEKKSIRKPSLNKTTNEVLLLPDSSKTKKTKTISDTLLKDSL